MSRATVSLNVGAKLGGGLNCANSVFGDPLYGVGKTCFCDDDGSWVRCA